MPIQVTRMKEADIDGAIDTIQQAFANDPYNNWVFPDREKAAQCGFHPGQLQNPSPGHYTFPTGISGPTKYA
ncbi:unnamed protein product [Alternaria alternata]